MTKERKAKTERALAAELHARRDDPGEWSEKAVRINVKPKQDAIVTFRMPSDEFLLLQEAAQAHGETLSEFVRNAVSMRIHGVTTTLPAQVTGGGRAGTLYIFGYSVPRITENSIRQGWKLIFNLPNGPEMDATLCASLTA